MKTKLDDALRRLVQARKRLADGQGHIARRNARRVFTGALRSVVSNFDREYPITKSVGSRKRKRPWRRSYAVLYVDLASEIAGHRIPAQTSYSKSTLNSDRWTNVRFSVARGLGRGSSEDDLWRSFWSKPIPVTDLRLAARHQRFLEKRGVK